MPHDPPIHYPTLEQPDNKDYEAPPYTIFSGFFLSADTFFSALFSNTLSSLLSLDWTDQVLHPYSNTTCEIILCVLIRMI